MAENIRQRKEVGILYILGNADFLAKALDVMVARLAYSDMIRVRKLIRNLEVQYGDALADYLIVRGRKHSQCRERG
jgi:hypothetical protein